MHPFHMAGVAGMFGGSLFKGNAWFSSYFIFNQRDNRERESKLHGYKFGQEEEIYNIVVAHGYFGRLSSNMLHLTTAEVFTSS